MVQSNNSELLYPQNFFSANAGIARIGLGLAAHTTNPTVALTNGGTGATNAAGARTNLGLGFGALTNTSASSFRSEIGIPLAALTNTNLSGFLNSIGLADSSEPTFVSLTLVEDTNTLVVAADPAITRTNLGLPWSGLTNASASGFRSALSLSATWLTNTNVTNFRTAIGLGATNVVSFGYLTIADSNSAAVSIDPATMNTLFSSRVQINSTNGIVFGGVNSNTAAAVTRTNLSLGLPALTNTSNVGLLQALAGVTNGPATATIYVSDPETPTTWGLVFSNGILVNVFEL